MKELTDGFLKYLVKEKAAAENTIEAYRTDLRQFAQFLRQRKIALAAVNQKVIRDYLNVLKKSGYSQATINRRFSSLKSFFRYLTAERTARADPTKKMTYPYKLPEIRPRVLTPKEMMGLLRTLSRSLKPEVIRDRAILELIYDTGMRVKTLLSLDTDMVKLNLRDPSVLIRQEREEPPISITGRAAHALTRYLREVRPRWVPNKEEKALFVNRRGERISRQGVWINLKQYAKEVGLKGQVTAQTVRYSFVSHQLDSGQPLEKIQRRLGHAKRGTTLRIVRRVKAL